MSKARQSRHLAAGLATLGFALTALACTPQQTPQAGGGNSGAPVAAGDLTGGFIGKTATGFSLPDSVGKTTDVGKVLGTKPVVLVFYRGVW